MRNWIIAGSVAINLDKVIGIHFKKEIFEVKFLLSIPETYEVLKAENEEEYQRLERFVKRILES